MGLLRSLRCSSGHNNKTTNVFVFQLIIVLLSQTLLFLLEDVLNMTLLRCLRWQTRHNSTIHLRAEDASGIYFPDDFLYFWSWQTLLHCVELHSVDGCKFPMAIKLGRVTSVPKFTKWHLPRNSKKSKIFSLQEACLQFQWPRQWWWWWRWLWLW